MIYVVIYIAMSMIYVALICVALICVAMIYVAIAFLFEANYNSNAIISEINLSND